MFRTIRFTSAALIASYTMLWACSSTDAQVYDVNIDAVAPEDIPAFGIEAGNPAVFTVTVDFGGIDPLHPTPVSSLYLGAPAGDAALGIDGPGKFQYTDATGATVDALIDAGFHFVELHIQDISPIVLVDDTDIGATDIQINLMLRDTTGDALFPTGDLPDLLGLDDLDTFEVVQLRVAIGTESGNQTIDLEIVDLDITEFVPPDTAYFHKFLVDGPDRNNDGEIDLIIEAKSKEPSTYTFRIEVNQPNQPPMKVYDFVPETWIIVNIEPDNPEDWVQLHHEPSMFFDFRELYIEWRPTGNHGGLTCTFQTMRHKHRHLPKRCGPVAINGGASAHDATSGNRLLDDAGHPLTTNPLLIGAVKDKNHDGAIDWSGFGDEDGDGLSDGTEIFIRGTDPCDDDTDHDHVDDLNDNFPLDKSLW